MSESAEHQRPIEEWRTTRTSAVVALLLLAGGLWMYLGSADYPEAARRAPRVVAAALVVFSIIVLVRNLRIIVNSVRRADDAAGPRLTQTVNFADVNVRRFAIGIMLVVYLVLFPRGFIWSTSLVVAAGSYALGMRKPVYLPLGFGILSALVLYMTFVHFFNVRLP